jgi:hypothetical protein
MCLNSSYNVTNDVIKPLTPHTCTTDSSAYELRKFDEEIAHCVRNTQETLDIIVTNSYKGKTNQVITTFLNR